MVAKNAIDDQHLNLSPTLLMNTYKARHQLGMVVESHDPSCICLVSMFVFTKPHVVS